MPITPIDPPLTLVDQAILTRLRSKKPRRPGELVKPILSLAPTSDEPVEKTQATILARVDELRRRGLVEDHKLCAVPAGDKALCDALGARRKPTWDQFCQWLATRALDLPPASDHAKQAFGSRESLALTVLRQRAPLPPGHKIAAVGDALIRELLGLPAGKITLAKIRQYAVLRRLGQQATGNPFDVAASMVNARGADKKSLIQALARQAFEREPVPRPITLTPAKPSNDDALLSLVHDAFPHIGRNGRVGPEKVFISALWHQLAGDRRAAELSLDHFKRWLVRANRDQLVALERADAVGAMDPRLVAESEIRSLGTTFHFVVDPRNGAPGARV
jgi:hypothetical protein